MSAHPPQPYQHMLRQFNVPPGVLSPQEIRMLRQGGIQIDGSDEEDYDQEHSRGDIRGNRATQPRAYGGGIGGQTAIANQEAYKALYQDQLSMKDKQIQYLQQEILHREQLLEAERHRLLAEHQLQQERTEAQLRRARAKIIHTEGQIPLIKEAVTQVREMLSGAVSQTVYLRLKDIPERQLPPSQWLLVNVWELVYPYRKELQMTRKDTARLREDVKILNDKQHTLLGELEHYSRLLTTKDDDEKRHVLNFENSRKGLELEIDKLREELELVREKGARYDEVFRDYQFVKQEKELIEQKLAFYSKDTTGDTGAQVSQEEARRRKTDLLLQDKEYLTKENIQLLQKNRRFEDKLDRLEAQFLAEKNRSEEYLHQLLTLKTDSVSVYEQKIYRQISQLKEKHNHELEVAKNNLVDIYEKQIQFLKDSIDEKDTKLALIDRNLKEKSRECENLLLASRDFQRKFEGQASETRIQLRIRTEELDRVNHIYQETLANLNAQKAQNNMLREKLDCIKGEYYKSQAGHKDELSSLKAQVLVLREQLENYRLIEAEVDQAVISLASLSPNDQGLFASTLNSAPTSSKRRMQQALSLAQRLQAKQKEHESTLEQLQNKEKECEKLTDELKVARALLESVNQPSSYLLASIEQKDRQILVLRNESRKGEKEYEAMREEYRQIKRQLEEAEKDVQRLLVKRQSIQHIQTVLIELTRGPTSSAQINSAVQEIRQILGTPQTENRFKQTGSSQQQPIKDAPNWYKTLMDKRGKQ